MKPLEQMNVTFLFAQRLVDLLKDQGASEEESLAALDMADSIIRKQLSRTIEECRRARYTGGYIASDI